MCPNYSVMKTTLLTLLSLLLTAAAPGQIITGEVPDVKDRGDELKPLRVAIVEPGQPIRWMPVRSSATSAHTRESVNWLTAYDSIQWTLTNTSSSDGTNFYGASPAPSLPGRLTTVVGGSTRYVDYSHVVDDIQLRSGVNDGTWPVHRFRTRFFYNPGGALPPSSGQSFSGNVTFFIGTARSVTMTDSNANTAVNPFIDALGLSQPTLNQVIGTARGVLIDFGTQIGGNKFLDLEMGRQLGVNLPLPPTNTQSAGIILAVGKTVAGEFVPLSEYGTSSANAQFRVYDNCSPTDPVYPGSNPSNTGNFHWIDDTTLTSAPAYVYGSSFNLGTLNQGLLSGVSSPQTELRSAIIPSGTGGGLDGRRLNVGIGLAVNSNAKKLTLTLSRSELAASSSGFAYDIARFVPCNSTGTVEKDSGGSLRGGPVPLHLTVSSGNPTQSTVVVRDPMFFNGANAYAPFYRAIVKPYRGLSAMSRVWDTSIDDTASIDFSLGDSDGDDEISILDYILLSRDYGLTSSDPGWNNSVGDGAPVDSDFDDDGDVSILDYIILATHFGEQGALRTL